MPAGSSTHVIFDLDGTLLDTEILYSRAAECVCRRYGAEFTVELKRKIMGGDTLAGAKLLVEALGLPISPETYVSERERELLALLADAGPMPGAERLIEDLVAQEVPMAIATSGHRAITEHKLRAQPFLSRISVVICGDEPRLTRPKPHPDIYLLAAKDLGAEPSQCVVIEDSLHGAQAGVAAGMRTFLLLDPRWGMSAEAIDGLEGIILSLTELSLPRLGLGRS